MEIDNVYLTKDLATITGLSIYTIKYYLKIGLIKESGRSPETHFRFFNDYTVQRLNKIRELRTQKLSLQEIRDILR